MAAQRVARLLPSLVDFPPSAYAVVHHPDVQLTPEEWIELAGYERLESDALCDPGVVGFLRKNVGPRYPEKLPVVAAAKVHEGR